LLLFGQTKYPHRNIVTIIAIPIVAITHEKGILFQKENLQNGKYPIRSAGKTKELKFISPTSNILPKKPIGLKIENYLNTFCNCNFLVIFFNFNVCLLNIWLKNNRQSQIPLLAS